MPLQVKEVGLSFDFAYCKGKKKNGEGCRNCVNKTKSEFCDWHLSQGHKRIAFGARPECAGTVLGAATYQPGKERDNFAYRGRIMTKKTVPKTLGARRTATVLVQTSIYSLCSLFGTVPVTVLCNAHAPRTQIVDIGSRAAN